VDRVSSEPFSALYFPANREFNREILRFQALIHAWHRVHAAQFTILS
jgi:hypothetical protein